MAFMKRKANLMGKRDSYEVVVIGGGAAGLMAAAQSAGRGLSTLLVEKNARSARKVMITGKGRCNVTNNCAVNEFIAQIHTNPKFLYSAISSLTPQDLMAALEAEGVPLKTERGSRVFPVSDKAADVVDALVGRAQRMGATIRQGEAHEIIAEDGKIAGVICGGSSVAAANVIISTGGLSYPQTGSTGDGYRLAASLGHTIVKTRPSLVPLVTHEQWCADLMGLSLKNVTLSLYYRDRKKPVFSQLGEMLFTHFGISGPLVLSASAYINPEEMERYKVVVDLKPALNEEILDKRLQKDFTKYNNKDFLNALVDLLPAKSIPVLVNLSGIPGNLKVHQITKEQRHRLGYLIKHLPLTIKAFRPIEEAVVTAGGISVKEIDPRTMMSKLVRGLYFAGEVMDVDAYTGGFNLQIAFSTGYLAGNNVFCGRD